VRASLSYQLQSAAEAELLKHTSIIDIDDLYSEADKAFEALSILLGANTWFFGHERPALFDASVFAYTHLLLDNDLGWKEKKLCAALKRRVTTCWRFRELALPKQPP
jgi:metaxin